MEKKTLLLVDDTLDFRAALVRALKNDFKLFSAGTAHEAIQHIESGATIDILVTDFDLKGADKKDGLDIARAMRGKNPQTPIVLVTGTLPDHSRIKELLSMPHTRFVGKPFTKKDLMKALESASDTAQTARV